MGLLVSFSSNTAERNTWHIKSSALKKLSNTNIVSSNSSIRFSGEILLAIAARSNRVFRKSLKIKTEDKAEFIKILIAAGLKTIETTSFVNPKKIPQMSDGPELINLLKRLYKRSFVDVGHR